MAGYTRQSSFADGDTITAALFNDEYNQLVNAFSNTTGHSHDGTAASGPVIGLIGDAGETSPNNKVLIDTTNNYIEFYVEVSSSPVQQLYIADGAIVPVTDSDVDLGTSSLYFKDSYIDTVTTTGNVSVGGNLTVTGNATISGNLTFGDADTDSINLAAEIDSHIVPNTDDTYDLGTTTKQWRNLYIDGTAEIDTLALDGTTITSTAAELNILDGVTSTATELNILDGVTATTAEINLLDGVTATTSELNILDGVTSTATELNIVDGDTAATSTTLADADRVVVNDAGTMKQVALTDFETYFEGALDTLSNVTTVGALNSGSITSGFGAIDNGSSAITTTGTVTYGNLSDGTITITAFVDEDDMSSNSATLVPTQQSVKAYVDSQVTAQDLDFQGDTGGALSIDLDSESLTIAGGTGIDTSGATNTLTIAIDSTVATLTGTQTLTNKTLTSPDVNTPDIDGGTIDGTVIGGTTTAAGSFTTLQADTSLNVDGTLTADGLTVVGSGSNIRYDVSSSNPHTNPTLHLENQNATDGNVAALMLSADNANGVGGSAYIYAQSETTNQKGNLVFAREDGANTPVTSMKLSSNGDISFYEDTGTTAQMTWDASADALTFTDNTKAIFGAGSDLEIYSDGGSNNYILSNNGALILRNLSDDKDIYLQSDDGSGGFASYLHAKGSSGEVILKHYGSNKLATTSTGIDVTGTVVSDGVEVDGLLHIDGSDNSNVASFALTRTDASWSIDNETNFRIYGNTGDTTNPATKRFEIGTGGDISFYDDTGTSQALFWDASAESLGIGTTSPDGKLHVKSSSSGATAGAGGDELILESSATTGLSILSGTANDGNILFGDSGNSAIGYVQYKHADNALNFGVNGGVKATIDSSGNVGIGTTSPSEKLTVDAQSADGVTTTIASFHSNEGESGDTAIQLAVRRSDSLGSDRRTFLNATGAGNFEIQRSGSTKAVIDGSGNVGIGETSPEANLHIKNASAGTFTASNSQLLIENNTTVRLTMVSPAANACSIEFGDIDDQNVGVITYDHSGNYMNFKTNAADAMRIDSSGNVGIGTSSPSAGLQVAKGSSTIPTAGASTSSACFGNASSDDNYGVVLGANSSGVGYISSQRTDGTATTYNLAIQPNGGNVGIGTTSPSHPLTVDTGAGTFSVRAKGGSSVTIASDASMTYFGDTHEFSNAAGTTEFGRFDSSGNLLLHTTNNSLWNSSSNTSADTGQNINTVYSAFSRHDGQAVYMNRTGSDGKILQFNKSGSQVGSIGSYGGTDLTIGSGDTGLRFYSAGDKIWPYNTSTGLNSDALVTLGDANKRFKDLYLSGGVYIGGTGSANHLDDYEEGTWTPTLNSGTFSSHTATYTKVGRVVTIILDAVVGTGGGSNVTLPFTCTNTTGTGIYVSGQDFATGRTQMCWVAASGLLYFRTIGDNIVYSAQALTAGATIHATLTYNAS